jgi:UDPglucose 6-dehydrogenase
VLVSVIGCGYLGAVHAAALASLGLEVVGVDTDQSKIELLAEGRAPFYEPGLEELLLAGVQSERLGFTTDLTRATAARVHFICVGTPQLDAGLGADLSSLQAAVTALVPLLRPGTVVVGKSTVPVGTARSLAAPIHAAGAELIWNPEFLREGFAVKDTLGPDRIVYGLADPSSDHSADSPADLLDRVYGPLLETGAPRLKMSYESAELVKTSANSYLALRVSFINAISDLADASGAEIRDVAAALRLDERIGHRFLDPGLGFGGGCLPKDLHALTARAQELGLNNAVQLLNAADAINADRCARLEYLVTQALGGTLTGRRVAALGLSFKPMSDDVRSSQAVLAAQRLKAAGALVTATDPAALANAQTLHPTLSYAPNVRQAVAQAEAVVLLTEWPEYQSLDPVQVSTWTPARIVVDGRGALDPEQWTNAGWKYHSLGSGQHFRYGANLT